MLNLEEALKKVDLEVESEGSVKGSAPLSEIHEMQRRPGVSRNIAVALVKEIY